MDEVRFKSDKHCEECRKQIRKNVIQEVQQCCKGCSKANKIDTEKQKQILHKSHGRWKR